MKKLIVSALLIAFGSVYAHAMDDAPSVSIGGSAKLGVKNSDDGDPKTEDFTTVGEYDISLSSSGVTDGGLEFGASINIDGRKDNTIKGDNFQVYIGASDGSWKLQFGEDADNAGIDLVGNIGLANADNISGATLEAVTPVPLTEAEAVNVLKGDADNLNGAALLAYLKAETGIPTGNITLNRVYIFDGGGDFLPVDQGTTGLNLINNLEGQRDADEEVAADEDDIFQLYDKPSGTARANDTNQGNRQVIHRPITQNKLDSKRTNIQLSGSIAGFEYRLSSGEGRKAEEAGWSLGAKYALDNLSFGLGLDHNKVQALSAGGSFDGNNINLTYIRQNKGDTKTYYEIGAEAFDRDGTGGNDAYAIFADRKEIVANKVKAYGISFGRDLGSGTSITTTYSKVDQEALNVSLTRLELNFSYDLGGGATFYTEIDKDDAESNEDAKFLDVTEKTVIEAGVKMKF